VGYGGVLYHSQNGVQGSPAPAIGQARPKCGFGQQQKVTAATWQDKGCVRHWHGLRVLRHHDAGGVSTARRGGLCRGPVSCRPSRHSQRGGRGVGGGGAACRRYDERQGVVLKTKLGMPSFKVAGSTTFSGLEFSLKCGVVCYSCL